MSSLQKDCLQTPPFVNNVTRAEFTELSPDFVWGSATSAYQIEGAATKFGKGLNIWDKFCAENPAAIVGGDTGFDGINAYYKTKEDVQSMRKLGITAYRFSISWSRLLPGGSISNGVNREGIDYYNNLINELIHNGITPYVTLHHWDTPNMLEQEYLSFLDRKIVCDFKAYAELCFWEFGDRVLNWITFNEPANYSNAGYDSGVWAPGRGAAGSGVGNAATEPYIVAHNILLSHAAAVELYRQRFQASQGGKIGITLDCFYMLPLDPDKEDDKAAARRYLDFHFGWFCEPVTYGRYPAIMRKNAGPRLPEFTEEEARLVKGSYDFIGLNYYCTYYATTALPTDVVSYSNDIKVLNQSTDLNGNPIGPHGGVDWFYSYPPGLYEMLLHIKKTYGDPVIKITENGWPDKRDDTIKIEDALVDDDRITYMDAHFQSILQAMKDGVKVEGYFAWSLMDNFEWNNGYSVRFGLIYVDYKDGKYTRYPKKSAVWLMDFLKSSAAPVTKQLPARTRGVKRVAATASIESGNKTKNKRRINSHFNLQ